jgi:ABC-2 type transport system ATP-binding protein
MSADTTPGLLRAADIHVSYGKFDAINNFDLSLHAGDTLGLLGLNGAGKSTLLRVLAGAMAPSRGRISVNGFELCNDAREARQCIGYAPDKPPVYPEFTVTEYLTLAAKLRRIAKANTSQAVAAAIDRCNLGGVENRVIGNLSHGYQQRINLAQALVHEPKLLILDEPANGLDPAQLLEMRALVKQVQTDQATIFSSHLLAEVQQVCNRVVVVNEGDKLLDMPLSELRDESRSTYELILQGKAQSQDLQDLPGVLRICSVDSQHWLVTTKAENGTATVDQIGEALLQRGLQLLEINPVRNHLEKLFSQLKINAGNTAMAAGEAS